MTRQKIATFFNSAFIMLGCLCFSFAVLNLDFKIVEWQFIALFVFTLTVGTRLSLTMPHSKLSISFSDAAIFLSFLVFSGETAIILASLLEQD